MNSYLLIAALLSALLCGCHFTYSLRHVLAPMLQAQFEPRARLMLHGLFHYVSTFLVLSTLILLVSGLDVISAMQGFGVVLFIALNFAIFAIWLGYILFISETKPAVIQHAQWIVFAVISLLSLLGLIL